MARVTLIFSSSGTTVAMKTFFVTLAIAVVAAQPKGPGRINGNNEGSCEIPQSDMDYMMSVGEGCLQECFPDMFDGLTGGLTGTGPSATGPAGRQDNGMGLVEFAEAYTCPMQCAMREMDLVYEEDGWPSIPKITAFFAESPMNSGDIGKCFCEGLKATDRPMKVLKDIARNMGAPGEELQGRSAFPQMRMDMSMLNDFINVQELPKMFKRLDEEDKAHVAELIGFAVFNHCIHDSYLEVCPMDFGTGYGPTGGDTGYGPTAVGK